MVFFILCYKYIFIKYSFLLSITNWPTTNVTPDKLSWEQWHTLKKKKKVSIQYKFISGFKKNNLCDEANWFQVQMVYRSCSATMFWRKTKLWKSMVLKLKKKKKKKIPRDYCLLEKDSEVKATQSCPTLWDPKDYTVHGILLARILEWVAFPFSRGSSQPRYQTQVSHIAGGFFTSWVTRETQECWSG